MKEINLSKIQKPFFIGIGGIGISAIARMFLEEVRSTDSGQGKEVRGSDMSDSDIVAELRKAGAKIEIGQSVDLVPADTDLIIYTVAIEVAEPKLIGGLKKRPVPVLSYPEMLGIISKDKFTIAVSGTHGKTTTTAMIAKIMMDAGLDPTVIVGSFLAPLNPPSLEGGRATRTNFIAGKSKLVRLNGVSCSGGYLVVEACEYQRSFLNINPTIAVITNIDNDHLDYYKDISDIAKAFGEFAAKVPTGGVVVTNPNDKNIKPALEGFSGNMVDYSQFKVESLKLKVPGQHNISNAKAALAVAEILNIDRTKVVESLNNFVGTWRRFEYKGKSENGAYVYDDYGHHPTEIKATLTGARELYPKNRIVVVFQPHLYSRTKILLDEFAYAFDLADLILLAPIYPAREAPDSAISSEILADRIRELGKKSAEAFLDFESIETRLKKELKGDDVLITLGAGEANKILDRLVYKGENL